MIQDYLALIAVIGIIAFIGRISRLGVWRSCRCGAQYCTSCSRKR